MITAHFRNQIRSLPSWKVRIVSLLEINLGDNYRTDCQSERQTQDLHEIVLAPSRQILECVNNMIHIKYPVSRALAQLITNHYQLITTN